MSVTGAHVPSTVPWARLLLTTALLALVGLANQASSTPTGVSDDIVRCDLDPPRDPHGLEACVSRSPRDVELLLDLGAAYEAEGRLAEARQVYRRAVAVDPGDAGARMRLGAALHRAGDLIGARREGRAALRFRPHDPAARELASVDDLLEPSR